MDTLIRMLLCHRLFDWCPIRNSRYFSRKIWRSI